MSNNKTLDELFLKETLRLAKQGQGWANPNPMVGAVIVKNGKVIGKGYHHKAGLPHAEIEALQNSKTSVKGATMYVSLEPHAYHGKTPPCTDAIIQAGIARVVCATLDPNPKVRGKGLKKLQSAGIKTAVGMLKQEARRLNEAFFTFHEKRRPFIVLKFAASLDGKIATRLHDSKWISNPEARQAARNLRSIYQSVLVGVNTVIRDNPHLGARRSGKPDPLRIILDTSLRIPMGSRVLRDTNALVVTAKATPQAKRKALESQGVSVVVLPSKKISLKKLMHELYRRKIISVLVEGGGAVLGSFVDEQLADKVYAVHAPILIGGEQAVSVRGLGVRAVRDAIHLKDVSYKRFGDNMMTVGYAQV